MTSPASRNTDLLHLMTSARSEHDRAIGDFIHRIWQALVTELTPAPALELTRRSPPALAAHPGH